MIREKNNLANIINASLIKLEIFWKIPMNRAANKYGLL